MNVSRKLFIIMLLFFQLGVSACSFNYTKYTDGPLTQYLTEPIPKATKPVARTLSVERVNYNTAGNLKAVMISDLVAREIYLLPEEVGLEVKQLLNMDNEFSKKATYAALNTIAKNRAKARHVSSSDTANTVPSTITANASTQRYIRRQESMAKAAYRKGDYLSGNIRNSAAINAMVIDQSFARAQASVDLTFAYLGGMKALGQHFIHQDFMKLRNWIEFESGAIDSKAPAGNHLSVFFLEFFDAESFQLDSRTRLGVFIVLTDKNGVLTSVLEGSDILLCEGECNLFQPKSTAKISEKTFLSPDVEKQFGLPGGNQFLSDNGFRPGYGIDQYMLLKHGLKKLTATTKKNKKRKKRKN